MSVKINISFTHPDEVKDLLNVIKVFGVESVKTKLANGKTPYNHYYLTMKDQVKERE